MHSRNKHLKSSIWALILVLSIQFTSAQEGKKLEEAKGLEVGTLVDNFTAKDQHNHTFELKKALKKGPVVLIFYRGQWCPICNKHLSFLQDSLSLIYAKGATVIAVSPEKPEYLLKTADKTKAEFSLLYDEGYKIADSFDVTFLPTSATTSKYNLFLGADLKNAHSDASTRLPIPATFIIDTTGKVIWRQFDPNYKNRSSVAEIIRALE